MTVDGLVLLAADTLRSRAYAQALLARGHRLRAALRIRSPGRAPRVPAAPRADFGALFAPDLARPLADSLAELCDDVRTLDAESVNDARAVSWLAGSGARAAIYSGFGGQIVEPPALAAVPLLLHLHSGWLPDYRGSTTLYYSALLEGACGVTAIALDAAIDTGAMLRRKRYPLPPPGADVDHAYDSAIRADLLADLVDDWARTGSFGDPIEQDPAAGRTYYIVHPVLKHVALRRIHGARWRAPDAG